MRVFNRLWSAAEQIISSISKLRGLPPLDGQSMLQRSCEDMREVLSTSTLQTEQEKKCVIIESPYAGNLRVNLAYAHACARDSHRKGEAPFLSHLLYTQFLDDANDSDRAEGMESGFAWMRRGDFVAVYTDLGISSGMKTGIERAMSMDIPVECRTLPDYIDWRPDAL